MRTYNKILYSFFGGRGKKFYKQTYDQRYDLKNALLLLPRIVISVPTIR